MKIDLSQFEEHWSFVKQTYDDPERERYGVQVWFFESMLRYIDKWHLWRKHLPPVPKAMIYLAKEDMRKIFEEVDERAKRCGFPVNN